MNNFALDKNYSQFDFEEITVADLVTISGGSGGSVMPGGCIPYPPIGFPPIGFPPIGYPPITPYPGGSYFG